MCNYFACTISNFVITTLSVSSKALPTNNTFNYFGFSGSSVVCGSSCCNVMISLFTSKHLLNLF